MIKLLVTTILGLSIVGGTNVVPLQQAEVKNQNEILIQAKEENFTTIQWHNNQYPISKDEASLSLFSEYAIEIDDAQTASDIYIQEEYIPFEEVVPAEYVNANADIALMSIDHSQEEEFIHNNGYIKFTTKAYAIGFYDGKFVYHIEVTTEQLKSFMINRNDNLIIRHGNNGVTLSHQDYATKGERVTPFTMYNVLLEPISGCDKEQLTPNYSHSDSGVYYTFYTGGASWSNDTTTMVYGNTKVTADYYLVATDVTTVQPVYVHNRDLIVNSLSISFGPIGAGVDVSEWFYDVMEGKVLTLKGYANRINQNVYTMNPTDWGFDERYYFPNEGLDYTTTMLGELTISTVRSRCGYIEGEYINLSPNRIGAGDAYLELTFSKPIYEMDTYLAFWSSSEGLYSLNGDYAYIQYKDVNGNWKTCIDLLACELPTDRTKPKYFEYDFIEGTYGIKFVAHKSNPNTNRNKGRICIGQTKFITCERN